jgi:hypothetical protein
VRLLLVGDLHANIERAEEINTLAISQDIDKVVGLGDFGYQFTTDERSVLSGQKVPWYFIDGNHDDHTLLRHDADEIVEFWPDLYYIPRGYVWEWEGKTFAAMGGASSIDKSMRTPYISWWPEEPIQLGDMYRLDDNVGSRKIDIFLSHEAPKIAVDHITKHLSILDCGVNDRMLLYQAWNNYRPRLWFHGHWHYRYEWLQGDTKFIGLGHDYDTIEEQTYILEV